MRRYVRFIIVCLGLVALPAGVRPGCTGVPAGPTTQSGPGGDPMSFELVDISPTAGVAPLEVSFDSGGDEATDYRWDFGDGQSGIGVRVSHVYATPGVYTAELTTSGDSGARVAATERIYVLPAVTIESEPTEGTEPDALSVTFFATTNDPIPDDLPDFEYHWDFGDGNTGEGAEVVHAFSRVGTYTVVLSLVSTVFIVDCDQHPVNVETTSDDPVDVAGWTEGLTVYPDTGFEASGPVGGPFTPESKTYTLSNIGETPVDWTAAISGDWAALSEESGRLQPGETVEVVVTLNKSAATFGAGDYNEIVTFNDVTLGGDTTASGGRGQGRDLKLKVGPPSGELGVTPLEDFSTSAEPGGVPNPPNQVYTLENRGRKPLDWTASATQSWVLLSKSSGSLTPGATDTVMVSADTSAVAASTLPYTDNVTFTNQTNGAGTANRNVQLVVTDAGGGPPPPTPGVLTVTPVEIFSSSGSVGGPFAPAGKAYTLTNTGGTSLDWSASKTRLWLDLSGSSGTLAPHASTTVTVLINANAAGLSAGTFNDTVTFTNETDGTGDTTRGVVLDVTAASGTLSVSPATDFSSSGQAGGPFSPAGKIYQVTNTGGGALDWSVTTSQPWLSLSNNGGTLPAGGTATVTVSINPNANALPAGTYNDTVTITNETDGSGDTTRGVVLTVTAGPGELSVSPATDFISSGQAGGPFVPASKSYTVSNTGGTALDWSVGKTQAWLNLSSTGGTLPAGGSATVTVSIAASANSLTAGTHNDTVAFTNETDGSGDTTRDVLLTVTAAPGVLSVAPTTDFTSSGEAGGPFAPASKSYTVSNTGGTALDWSVTKTQAWLNLSSNGGTLAAGGSATVTVSIAAGATGLSAGVYHDTVAFTNETNGSGDTTRAVALTVANSAGVLSVTPADDFSSSGQAGGPFAPASKSYTLTNNGGSALAWSVSKSQAWLNLSSSGGTLAAGGSATVTVSINANANALPTGTYSDTVAFRNQTDGTGNATRGVELTVTALPGALSVSPATDLTSSGQEGGPFSPAGKIYTVTNTGGSAVDWSVSRTQPWLTLSSSGGTLAAGGTVNVNVTINAASLAAGSYSDTLTFTNETNGSGNMTRAVQLTVTPAPGVLSVSPADGFTSSGDEGGPFSPASKTYTLANTGGQPLNWDATKTQAWVSLSKTSGFLAAGASDTVVVSLNAAADSLSPGDYSDPVKFANLTTGDGDTTRTVSLTVQPASGCEASTSTWQNFAFASQSGAFTAEFDATPNNAGIDCITALSAGSGTSLTDFAILVRFNVSGYIDARNGDAYQADTALAYTPGTTYHFRLAVNVAAHTYTVYVTPEGAAEQPLATGYVFRTEQSSVTYLDTWAILSNAGGSHEVCAFTVADAPRFLDVMPADSFSSAGPEGGPFTPASKAYTLTNTSGQPLDWTASKTQAWLSLSSSGGTLAAGGTATVTASLNANATGLAAGTYNDTITFTNTTDGAGNTTRAVSLTVASIGGPSLVLDIPTPAAVRMDPCPVFASLDFDASSTGDGSTWDQCLIRWTLSRNGGLGPWPAKYRYVDDPRPGLEGVQRDLATAGRGFNMAWLLTEGTWTITCTVTNPSREVIALSSEPIVVAANTRTKKYVNSATGVDDVSHGNTAGNPYATLGYAFMRHGGTNSSEYVLAGGHVEDRASGSLSASGFNAYVHWDIDGSRPTIQWTADTGGYPTIATIASGSEGQVWEGIRMADVSGGTMAGTTRVSAFSVGGSFCAVAGCEGVGLETGNRLDKFIMPGGAGPTGVLAINCVTGATRGYSLVYTSGRTYSHHAVIGCDFGVSTNESVLRTTAPVTKMQVLYSRLIQNGSKSCLRFVAGEYQHAYGCRMQHGEVWLGQVDNSGSQHSDLVRFEANYLSGSGAYITVRQASGSSMSIANNIVISDTGALNVGGGTNPEGHEYIRLLSNTVALGHESKALASGGGALNRFNEARSNLLVLTDPASRFSYARFVDIGAQSWSAFSDNVYPPKSITPQEFFAEVDGVGIAELADWIALPFVVNEWEVDTTLDVSLAPLPGTNVNTPAGVYDDYYGNIRNPVSWAGAVGTTP